MKHEHSWEVIWFFPLMVCHECGTILIEVLLPSEAVKRG